MNPTALTFASRNLRGALCALWLPAAALAPGAAQAIDPFVANAVGVTAGGSIDYAFRVCFTCFPIPTGQVAADIKDHAGSSGPVIVSLFETLGDAIGDTYGRALIVGLSAGEPYLSAKAYAAPGVGSHPNFDVPGVYQIGAGGFANARQHYTYIGLFAQDYTVTFTLTGNAYTLAPGPKEGDYAAIQVNGGLTIWDGKNPSVESPLGGLVDTNQKGVNGSAGAFSETASVSISVNPGDSFFLQAFLSANVSVGGWGSGDASNSLSVAFTAGDTSLLTPLLAAVPEPSTYALMLLGLGLTAAAARRRRG